MNNGRLRLALGQGNLALRHALERPAKRDRLEVGHLGDDSVEEATAHFHLRVHLRPWRMHGDLAVLLHPVEPATGKSKGLTVSMESSGL